MVTLKDIAQEAGVSPMTVSNVINGNMARVSRSKAELIQGIIERRNYVPNAAARGLVCNSSRIIAVIIRGTSEVNILVSPFNATAVGTIIQKVKAHGYYTMVYVVDYLEEIGRNLRAWNVSGAIIIGFFDDDIGLIHDADDIPKIFIDSYSHLRRISNVGLDDHKGGELAAQYLIDKGHREIAFVAPPLTGLGVIQHRYEGFRRILSAHNIPRNKDYEFCQESTASPDSTAWIVRRLTDLRGRVTAVFATSDHIASYLITGLHALGVRVPEDISVIGFDNIPLCMQITPQLTTIAQDIEHKAALAVAILFRQLADKNAGAESVTLDVSLIERDSVRQR
ncbi:MAG: LacI family transcriptional regulator [Treponema sp.]|jgi:LacI family transcriptional regulator|nr:LacI family transcriptional regulator [Treponema sp.]